MNYVRIENGGWSGMKANDFGIVPDSNLERLLKTLRFEKTDRVPNWELIIEARTVEHFTGKRVRSISLPVEDMVQLSLMLQFYLDSNH